MLADLRGRQRSPAVVRARETLALLGVERYGLRVVDLARAMDRSPDGVTKAIARASRRRAEDERYRLALDHLDHTIATTPERRTTAVRRDRYLFAVQLARRGDR